MMKLKEIAVMAKNDTSYAEEIRKFIEQTAKEDYFGSFPMLQYKVAGQDRVTVRCTCGEHADIDNYWSTWSCKKCGKIVTYGMSTRTKNLSGYRYVTVIKKFDEGFFVNYYETEVSIVHGNGTVKEQLDNPEVINYRISPVCMAVYSKKYGPALYEGKKVNRLQYVPSSLYRTESLKVFGDLNEIKTEYSCDTVGISMQDIWATMKALPFEDSGVNAAKKADKEEKERRAEAEIRKNVDIEAATAEMEKIAHGCFPSGTEEYETSTSGSKLYVCACGKCGHVFTSHDRKDLICEECGSNINVCSYIQKNINVLLTDWSVDAEGNLILARYSGDLSPVGNMADWVKAGRSKYRLDPASVRLCDLARFTNTPSARPVKWVVGPSDFYAPWGYSSEHYVRTPLSDVVGMSSFKFANVEQVEKLTKDYVSGSGKLTNDPVVQYLENCAKYPFIVGLVSRGLYPVAEELCKYIDNDRSLPAQYRGKTDVREAMGISKTILKLATKYQMNLYEIRLLKAMMAEDSALSYECFDWFNTTLHETYCYTLRDIIASVNKHIIKPIHFEDVRTYLKSLYYDQCIDYTGGVQTWDDYLKAMDQLGFKPASYRQKLFPSSLKKEHDILQFAIRNIDMKDKAEAFKDTIETGKKLEYSFEDLMIRMPQSVEEIVEEGVHLHHSVAQHIEKVANKKEYIAFIREKATPDTPYYTVEVIREGRGKIVQVRSFSNLPADDRIKAFLKKWASYKKLTIASL